MKEFPEFPSDLRLKYYFAVCFCFLLLTTLYRMVTYFRVHTGIGTLAIDCKNGLNCNLYLISICVSKNNAYCRVFKEWIPMEHKRIALMAARLSWVNEVTLRALKCVSRVHICARLSSLYLNSSWSWVKTDTYIFIEYIFISDIFKLPGKEFNLIVWILKGMNYFLRMLINLIFTCDQQSFAVDVLVNDWSSRSMRTPDFILKWANK